MTNTSTLDTDSSVEQIERIAQAGGEIVRLTAQGVREASNLGEIRAKLRAKGYKTPLVADIHFNPKAAFAAADNVEKVRINPGNFVDPGRTFKKIEFTDDEYDEELKRLAQEVIPFLTKCRDNNVAVRIGVNHGSLSDRIMSRFGDTPHGMVESAMEFLRVAKLIDFNQIVISIKSSNTKAMVQTVRLLVDAMEKEDMSFPLHLGVTEAGEGEDGRIKSAIGIGSLLLDGIGDTIRVSLSEAPEAEIPVARELIRYVETKSMAPAIEGSYYKGFNKIFPERRVTEAIGIVGGQNCQIVVVDSPTGEFDKDFIPDFTDTKSFNIVDASLDGQKLLSAVESRKHLPVLLYSRHLNSIGEIKKTIHYLTDSGSKVPIIASLCYDTPGITPEQVQIRAAADFGSLLLDGLIDGIEIVAPSLKPAEISRLAFNILQGCRLRMSKTEYISCPGCGRTLFDLTSTIADIKKATSHLKNLKIGIMGCIVNGPGEMADADYGYVGAGKGKVSLYKGKDRIEKNIPQEEAIGRLIDLLKSEGKWHEPNN